MFGLRDFFLQIFFDSFSNPLKFTFAANVAPNWCQNNPKTMSEDIPEIDLSSYRKPLFWKTTHGVACFSHLQEPLKSHQMYEQTGLEKNA